MTDIDILQLAEQSAKSDATALLAAKESAKRRMHDDPTPANISAYDRASILFDKAMDRKKAETAPVPDAVPEKEPVQFRKLSEVVKWLKDEGYKIKKSKVYLDAKNGFLVQSDESGYTKNDVLAYVHTQSLDKIADRKFDKLAELNETRLQREVEKLTVQVQKLTWDMERDQGKYLLKEEVRTELALKISAFEGGFKHLVATSAQDWTAAVGGRPEKAQVLIEMMHSAIDALLEEFAAVDELDLVIIGES